MQTNTSSKIKIKETPQGLTIQIPSEKNWSNVFFLVIGLGGCIIAEIDAIYQLIEKEDLSDKIAWIIMIACIATIIIFVLIKTPLGKETIEFRSDLLIIKRDILFLLRGKAYELKQAKDFTIGEPGFGSLKFQYGLKIIYFADDADQEDSTYLLQLLESKKLVNV